MSYNHSDMPPVLVRTGDSSWVLEGQSGIEVATYDFCPASPGGWYDDMQDALVQEVQNNNDYTAADAALDMNRLSAVRDWGYRDDR